MITLLKRQCFVIGISVAVLLAFKIPEWGASGGRLRSDTSTEVGIILVFLFQGWLLPTEVLKKCMLRWKAHLFIQLFIFGIFPVIIILGDLLWSGYLPAALRTGFFFLAVLPTTITSAIIYTSQAGGNTVISLANTTIANLAGVLITPLWMTLLVNSGSSEIGELGNVFLKLTKLILLPFFVGQIAHLVWKSAVAIIKVPVGYLNQAIIIFIVFAAFSNSVVGGVWEGQGASLVVLTITLSLIVFSTVLVVCLWGVQILNFAKEDIPAIFYCSTQKTLAAAVPLGISLFGSDPTFGIILLPAIIYHPVQLIFGALLFGRFRKQIVGSEET